MFAFLKNFISHLFTTRKKIALLFAFGFFLLLNTFVVFPANARSNPFEECETVSVGGGAIRRCADSYANHLGISTPCDKDQNGECISADWNRQCIRACLIYEGDQVSLKDCSWNRDKTRCAVLDVFFQNEWPAAEATFRRGCDTCMDTCWYSVFYGRAASIDQCANEGVGAPGGKPCKASTPDHLDRACPNVYINDWKSTNPSPWDQSDKGIKKLCEVGCDLYHANGTDQDREVCKTLCIGQGSIAGASNMLKKLGATPEVIAGNAAKIIDDIVQQLLRGLNYNQIQNFNFVALPGGFGSGNLDVKSFIADVWTVGSVVLAGLAILKIVFAGIMYTTSMGNSERVSTAKSHIIYAIIGLVLLIGMNIFLSLVGAGPFNF